MSQSNLASHEAGTGTFPRLSSALSIWFRMVRIRALEDSTSSASVAFLAFMRWHVTYGRNAFPNSFSLLFVGLCLLFFLKAVATRRMGWFLALGAALGAGLCVY